MPEHIRFTEAVVRSLPLPPAKKKATYLDFDPPGAKQRLAVPGFELVVSYTGVKSYVLRKKLNGRVVAVTLGRHPAIDVETARKLASKASRQMAEGVNPNQKKKAEQIAGVTLEDCYKEYIEDRKLAANTLSNYKTVMDSHLKGWKKKPMKLITRNMVGNRHKDLSKVSPTSANKTMRVLRSLFNYANGKYEDGQGRGLFPDNPVQRLTHTKTWNKEGRRDNTIKRTQLAAWFKAVGALSASEIEFDRVVGDYLQFVLLTGLRRREATSLKVLDVDFKEKAFTIYVTKNNRPLALPMSDYTKKILERRCKETTTEYVFHGSGESGRLNDPRRLIKALRKSGGVEFTVHDLRRSFITLAESLDISGYALKRLVNHSPGGDVTAGYVRMDVERLRKPTQDINDYILKLAKVKTLADVTPIGAKNKKG
tara:strand:- start:2973 stop:4247 length:1275 start_codon:yes stop_codon:yes gene_type:complete